MSTACPLNLNQFITESPFKSKARHYTITYKDGTKQSFTSPIGFQHLNYFSVMFPKSNMDFKHDQYNGDLTITVTNTNTNELIASIYGVVV